MTKIKTPDELFRKHKYMPILAIIKPVGCENELFINQRVMFSSIDDACSGGLYKKIDELDSPEYKEMMVDLVGLPYASRKAHNVFVLSFKVWELKNKKEEEFNKIVMNGIKNSLVAMGNKERLQQAS